MGYRVILRLLGLAALAAVATRALRPSSRLARDFDWSEVSPHRGTATADQRAAMRHTIELAQALRDTTGAPVVITSGIRTAADVAAGIGSATSPHLTGDAIDVSWASVPGATPAAKARYVADVLRDRGLAWDQIIAEEPGASTGATGHHVHIGARSRHGVRGMVGVARAGASRIDWL